jgi:DNA processing protein
MIGVGRAGAVREAEPSAAPAMVDEAVGRNAGRAWAGWSSLDLAVLDAADERPYWLALSLVPGIGPVSFGRILARHGSARRGWERGQALLTELDRVPAEAAGELRRLQRIGPRGLHRKLEDAVSRSGGRIVTAMDDRYPPALAATDPRPPVLYVCGDDESLTCGAVAVVGTRRASGYGRSVAIQVADLLARSGIAVVSGLALGIDGEAHAAALDAGGRTVAVLPSPLDRVYPPRHRTLAARIVAAGGALVSELAPGQLPGRPDFARRNRIIAGLARATVIVEAPDRSGALLTAAAAVALGRDVYAVPGPIDAVASRGCNRLIADHLAALVTSPAALLTAIGMRSPASVPGSSSVAGLSESEAMVLARLLMRPASVDELLGPTRLSTGALASALTLLEARGLVESYGGATFHPTLSARRLARLR